MEKKPRRKNPRLENYDYSTPGAYFVTVCAEGRIRLFGGVENGIVRLSPFGALVETCWREIPKHFPKIVLDQFVIMPNHLHGIIFILDKPARPDVSAPGPLNVGAPLVGALSNGAGTRPAPTLGEIMGAFKSRTTNLYIEGVRKGNFPPFKKHIWQRSYYDRVVRNEKDLLETRRYIMDNPPKWDMDPENR